MFQCCHQILSVTEAEVHSQDEVSGCLSFQRYQKFQSIIKDRFETPVQLSSEGPSIHYVITFRVHEKPFFFRTFSEGRSQTMLTRQGRYLRR